MIIKKKKQKFNIKETEAQTQTKSVSNKIESIEQQPVLNDQQSNIIEEPVVKVQEPEMDLFDIENIDFTQRQERRRGSRRRGYRRIDDRNLVSRAQEESENIKKSAFEEGYRLGLAKASSDMEDFRKQLEGFMSARKDVFEYIAPDILEISVDIAKKIIKNLEE